MRFPPRRRRHAAPDFCDTEGFNVQWSDFRVLFPRHVHSGHWTGCTMFPFITNGMIIVWCLISITTFSLVVFGLLERQLIFFSLFEKKKTKTNVEHFKSPSYFPPSSPLSFLLPLWDTRVHQPLVTYSKLPMKWNSLTMTSVRATNKCYFVKGQFLKRCLTQRSWTQPCCVCFVLFPNRCRLCVSEPQLVLMFALSSNKIDWKAVRWKVTPTSPP